MDKCQYYLTLDGVNKVFNSDLELITFIKNQLEDKSDDPERFKNLSKEGRDIVNNILANGDLKIKFSKLTGGLISAQERIKSKIEGASVKSMLSNYLWDSEFIKERFTIDDERNQLLTPYVDRNSPDSLSQAADFLLSHNVRLQEIAKTNPDEALAQAKLQVQHDWELDDRMKDIKAAVLTYITKSLTNQPTDITPILEAIVRYNLNTDNEELIKEEMAAQLKIPGRLDALEEKFKAWVEKLKTSEDIYLPSVKLAKEVERSNYKGVITEIPYIGIDSNGHVDIYDIHVARNPVKEWNPAKLSTIDNLLGIKRQLLGNIVNTADSSLYLQPIIFPTEGDKINIDKIEFGDMIDRSLNENNDSIPGKGSGLSRYGWLTRKIMQILPTEPLGDDAESQDLSKLNKQVLDLCFPHYNFRTKVVKLNAEMLHNKIVNDAISTNSNTLSFIDALKDQVIKRPNTQEGRQALKADLEDYYKRLEEAKHSRMINLQKAILTAKKGSYNSTLSKEIRFGRYSVELQHTFSKYLSPDWYLITNRPELIEAGVFLFRNKRNQTVEAVSITVNAIDQVTNLGVGNTILGKYKTDASLKNHGGILSATAGHIELMKALVVLNNNPDLIAGYRLNSVKVYNAFENKGDYTDLQTALYNFKALLDEVNNDDKNSTKITNNFEGGKDAKIQVVDYGESLYSEILYQANLLDLKDLKEAAGEVDDYTIGKIGYDTFIKLKETLDKNSQVIKTLNATRIPDYNNPLVYLNHLISEGIAYYSNVTNLFDFSVPRYGVGLDNVKHWAQTLLMGEAPSYDSNGKMITGLLQGSYLSTADAMKSPYMKTFMNMITVGTNEIRAQFNKYSNYIITDTKNYYEEVNRSSLEQYTLGHADKYHIVFFETDGNGQISKEFKLKNPWDDTAKLDVPQRKYLKRFIYHQYVSKTHSDKGIETFEKFEQSKQLADLLKNKDILDKLLRVPLIKKQGLTKYEGLTEMGLWKWIGLRWDEMVNQLDGRNLTSTEKEQERQKVKFYNSVNGFNRMYNQFDFQESETNRQNLIEEYKIPTFEINLDVIALKYALENIRESIFNRILPKIYAGMELMQYYGWQTGKTKEVEQALEEVMNRLNISVFDKPILKDHEGEKTLSIAKEVQHYTGMATMALRPFLMLRELLVGTIRNASYAWSKVYGKDTFTGDDLMEAYKLYFKGSKDFDLMQHLITEYGLANRDLSALVKKTKVDRYGLNFMSSGLYWFNILPDYFNRASLFFAKMKKDGTYEAYSVDKNGQLIYNPKKDKRYSYYFEMRDRYNYKFTGVDKKYDEQRRDYLYALEDFNAERAILNEKPLTEKDLLPRAYSKRESANMKTFADTAHGYYDTEFSPIMKYTVAGILFGQYLTYWPSTMRYYFGPNAKSIREHRVVKTTADGEPLFVEWTTDEQGNLYKEEVTKDKLKPGSIYVQATEWTGELNEGLMYSLAQLTHDLFTGNWEEAKNDPDFEQRVQQAKLMLHDLLLTFASLVLGGIFYKDLKKSPKDASKYNQYEALLLRLGYQSFMQFDPIGNTVGSLQATPIFLTQLAKAKQDFIRMISGHEDLAKFLHQTINSMELLPYNPVPSRK